MSIKGKVIKLSLGLLFISSLYSCVVVDSTTTSNENRVTIDSHQRDYDTLYNIIIETKRNLGDLREILKKIIRETYRAATYSTAKSMNGRVDRIEKDLNGLKRDLERLQPRLRSQPNKMSNLREFERIRREVIALQSELIDLLGRAQDLLREHSAISPPLQPSRPPQPTPPSRPPQQRPTPPSRPPQPAPPSRPPQQQPTVPNRPDNRPPTVPTPTPPNRPDNTVPTVPNRPDNRPPQQPTPPNRPDNRPPQQQPTPPNRPDNTVPIVPTPTPPNRPDNRPPQQPNRPNNQPDPAELERLERERQQRDRQRPQANDSRPSDNAQPPRARR